MSVNRAPGLVLLLLLAGAKTAWAEEGAYVAMAGVGASSTVAPVSPSVSLLVKSAYGLTERLSWEGPLWVDWSPSQTVLTVGTGLEWAFFTTQHWRANLGAGAALRLPFSSSPQFTPFAQAALRWRFAWGLGASLQVYAHFPVQWGQRPAVTPRLVPALALYTEF